MKDTFHTLTKGEEEHYCSASWNEGSNLKLVSTKRDSTGKISVWACATVASTSTVAVVLLPFSFGFLGRSLTTTSYKTFVNTSKKDNPLGFLHINENLLNTLRTGLLNCLNARSRSLTSRHRASCM